jgi:hypothetical protein
MKKEIRKMLFDVALLSLQIADQLATKHAEFFGENQELKDALFILKKEFINEEANHVAEQSQKCAFASDSLHQIISKSQTGNNFLEGIAYASESVLEAIDGELEEVFYYSELAAHCLNDDSLNIKEEHNKIMLKHKYESFITAPSSSCSANSAEAAKTVELNFNLRF